MVNRKLRLNFCLGVLLLSGCSFSNPFNKSPNPFDNAKVTERNDQITYAIPLEKFKSPPFELPPKLFVVHSTEDLQNLAGPGTRRLRLESTAIASENLKSLSKFKELEELDLHDTSFTDKDVRQIQSVKELYTLDLRGTKITDASLPILAAMNVSRLLLAGTDITSNGISSLDRSENLIQLDLSATSIGSDVGKKLVKIPYLTDLNLSDTSISNQTIDDISKNPSLLSLHLGNTKINDEAIPFILKYQDLLILSLTGSDITDLGRQRIKKELPNCHINE